MFFLLSLVFLLLSLGVPFGVPFDVRFAVPPCVPARPVLSRPLRRPPAGAGAALCNALRQHAQELREQTKVDSKAEKPYELRSVLALEGTTGTWVTRGQRSGGRANKAEGYRTEVCT